jgi:hypothetical protein
MTNHRIALVATLISGCASARGTDGCKHVAGAWRTVMIDSSANYRMGGTLSISGRSARFDGVDTTDEGSTQLWADTTTSFVVTSDSIRIRIAPIGLTLSGRCVAPDSIRGSVVIPYISGPYAGRWVSSRIRQ